MKQAGVTPGFWQDQAQGLEPKKNGEGDWGDRENEKMVSGRE
jgi:hypothetical protein